MTDLITRESYQVKRLEFLRTVLDIADKRGLEIGACDLPTVPHYVGSCDFADFRSADEMIKLWDLPPETVVPVKHVLQRGKPVSAQIDERYDYIVACHVLEHIPNPIGYILELKQMLDEHGSHVIILAIPDKRATADSLRISTSMDHLLMDFHDNAGMPSIEHIMEFSRIWSPDFAKQYDSALPEFYKWAASYLASGEADAHCHVWTDEEFFAQAKKLVETGLLGGLEILATQPMISGFNEFMIAFT